MAMYSPRRIYPPMEIPEVQNTVRVTKVTAFDLKMQAPETSVPITVAKIAASIPGGTTYWTRMRVSKVSIWADSASTGSGTIFTVPLTVTLPSSGTWSQPAISFTDSGIYGQSRACVGFKLGLLDQARWFGTASTDVICNLSPTETAPNTRTATVHVTVELMSPA